MEMCSKRRRSALITLLALIALASGAACDEGSPSVGDAAAVDAAVGDAAPDGAVGDGFIDGIMPGSDAEVPLAATAYCEAAVDVFCPYYLRCKRMAVSDLTSCKKAFLETCNRRYEPIYAALAQAGLLTLSASGLAACQAHLATVDCASQIFDLDLGCDHVWLGRAAIGEACGPGIPALICAPGSTCVLDLSFCGTCKKTAARGEACGGETKLACEAADTCVGTPKRCIAKKRVGESCSGANERCVLGARCAQGLCKGPSIVGVGEVCDAEHRCPYLSACVGGHCAQSVLFGVSCNASTPCASGRCVGGTCVPLAEPGAPCAASRDCVSGGCLGASGCAPLVGVCLKP